MKKLFCVVLVFLLVLGFAAPLRASAAENHCGLFETALNALGVQAPFWNVAVGEPFPLASIVDYARQLLSTEEYGREPITSGDFTYYAYYAIPAEVFEELVQQTFAVVDVEALRSYTSFFWDHVNFTGIDDFQNYQPDAQVYLFSTYTPSSEIGRYQVLGYTQAEALYTVYARHLSPVAEVPQDAEEGQYVSIDGVSYVVEHYLRAALAISDDQVQFHSWEEFDALPELPETMPLTLICKETGVSVRPELGAFSAGATLEIRQAKGDALALAQQALEGLAADFVAYDMTASAQPYGRVHVTFPIPEDFAPEKLTLFAISEQGVAQQLPLQVDAEAGTATVTLTHVGLCALALPKEAARTPGDVNGDGLHNVRDVRLVLQHLAGLPLEGAPDLKAADFNADGQVDVRDIRAMLVAIAGENV